MSRTDVERRLDHVLAIQREMSTTRPVEETLATFLRLMGAISPTEWMLHVLPWPRDETWQGAYRVLYDGPVGDPSLSRRASEAMNAAEFDDYPLYRGGIVSDVMQEGRPRIIAEAQIDKGDPALGHLAGRMRSVLMAPIYVEGRIGAWIVSLSSEPGAFDEEHMQLVLSNANMLVRAIARERSIDQLRQLGDKNEHQLREMAHVQRSLLPREAPDVPGWRIATSYRPSLHVGGDYYDFASFADGRHGVVIADISGHGAAAAAQMAVLRTILHTFSSMGLGPEELIEPVNRIVLDSVSDGMFLTAFFAVLPASGGEVACVNCGHHPPRIRRANGEVIALDGPGLPPMGIGAYGEIPMYRAHLAAGDALVLYTDGVTEAFDAQGDMFGVERLDEAISSEGPDPARMVMAIETAVGMHASGPYDDQTVVAVLFEGGNSG